MQASAVLSKTLRLVDQVGGSSCFFNIFTISTAFAEIIREEEIRPLPSFEAKRVSVSSRDETTEILWSSEPFCVESPPFIRILRCIFLEASWSAKPDGIGAFRRGPHQ